MPYFYAANEAQLCALASGRSTGLFVDIGDGVTNIVPIYEYSLLYHAV